MPLTEPIVTNPSRFKTPRRAPLQITCFACRRQFGTASLHIHQRTCFRMHETHVGKLPPRKQIPLPEPPTMPMPKSGDAEEVFNAFNDQALEIYKEHSKVAAPSAACRALRGAPLLARRHV